MSKTPRRVAQEQQTNAMTNLDVWKYLAEQPKTRQHLEAKYPASILRNMRRSKHLVEIDGLCHAGKQPMKKWSSNAERNAHYSMQWQRKTQADKGPKGQAFRAKRAQKKTSKPERVFVPRPPKPGQRKKPASIRIEPRKLGITEATPAKDNLPCTESWLAQNPDKLVRLPPGVWSNPVLRFEY